MQIYAGLQSRLGLINECANGFSWMLLRCIHNEQKILSTSRLAMMAECNSRLVVALTIMEECFLSMVDPRTGIDMIPHLVYSWKLVPSFSFLIRNLLFILNGVLWEIPFLFMVTFVQRTFSL